MKDGTKILQRAPRLVVCMTLLSAWSTDTHAASSATPGGVLAFPLLFEGNADLAIVHTVNVALEKAAQEVGFTKVWAGSELRDKLNVEPDTALVACHDDLNCIAQIGKKASADELLFGQARASGQGIAITFVAIASTDGAVLRSTRVDVASKDVADTVIGGEIYRLLGIGTPGTVEVAAIDASSLVEIDGTAAGSGPGWYEVGPGRHRITVGDYSTSVMVHPGKTTTVVKPRAEVGGAAKGALPSSAAARGASGTWSKRRYAEIIVFTSAAITLGAGVNFESLRRGAQNTVNDAPASVDAHYYQKKANDYRRFAHTAYAIAGCLAALGVGVLLYDWHVSAMPTAAVIPNSGAPGILATAGGVF